MCFIEYIKIFAMMAVSMVLLCTFDQIYCLLLIAVITLGYIAYEVNILYLSTGYIGIYQNGYGGLDNNGAGLDARHGGTGLYSALGWNPGPLAVVFPGPGSR